MMRGLHPCFSPARLIVVGQLLASWWAPSQGMRLDQREREEHARNVAPVVFVPGITSSPLEARRVPGKILGFSECENSIPKTGWYTLYVSAGQAFNIGCLLWQLKLQTPKPQDATKPGIEDGCVQDAEGLEIREVGFGTTEGSVLNPSDPVKFNLFENMIQMFEGIGLKRGFSIRYATYDWRKFGDRCWEREWFPRLQKLVEEEANQTNTTVNLACHSMGCPVVHVFLNTVSTEWKRKYVSQFIATGPAFAGATAILQNFIQGPTYDMVPMVFSTIGRAALTSFPSFYTLSPAQVGGSVWSEDMVIVETPWRNYTIASVYDGSFWKDIEMPEKSPDEEFQEEMSIAKSKSGTFSEGSWAEVRDRMSEALTDQGCVCKSKCSMMFGGPLSGMLDNGQDSGPMCLGRPWCYTHGKCGSKSLRLQLRPNPFYVKYWDFCGGESQALDAGPGFEFFPGVNTRKSNFLYRFFGIAESYSKNTALQVEEQKVRCLTDTDCTGFDTEGYLKRGNDFRPDKSWRGTNRRDKHGVLQGLYMKRPEVQKCQRDGKTSSSKAPVCGTDGVQYGSVDQLNNAKCWNHNLSVQNWSACSNSYRTPQGCECVSWCGAKANGADGGKRCYVKADCGYRGAKGKRWDYCGSILTGKGFEYVPRVEMKTERYILRKNKWFHTFHMDSLQESCGLDDACGGFTTTGDFLRHDFRTDLAAWRVSKCSKSGVYRKKATVSACQKTCADEPRAPVCYDKLRKTFQNACEAENYRCLQEMGRDEFQTFNGPCPRYGHTGLHNFAHDWVQRMSDLRPPDVPTTCIYITDVETALSWRYKDFQGQGEVIKSSLGDGTVNAQSAEVPCRFWKEMQTPPVDLIPMKLGGASHVTMLKDRGFLDAFKRVLLKDEQSCVRLDGGVARNSEEPPLCKCAYQGAKVFCGSQIIAERNFNLTTVLAQCSTPYCGQCDLVDGAIPRKKQLMPLCKCQSSKARVFCHSAKDHRATPVGERNFNLSEVLGKCSSPYCAWPARGLD